MRDEHFLLQYDAQDTPRPSWHSSIKLIFENPSRKRRRGIKSLTGHFVDNNTALVEVQVRTASSDYSICCSKAQTPPTGYGHPSLAGMTESVWKWQKLTETNSLFTIYRIR